MEKYNDARDEFKNGVGRRNPAFFNDLTSVASEIAVKTAVTLAYNDAKRTMNGIGGFSRERDGAVGEIAVGISDEHIWKMLSDPNIRMVIPYHKSGINPAVAVKLNIGEYTNYTDQQNTKRKDGGTLTKAELKNIPDINRLMHRDGLDAVEASRRYVEWCEDNGYIPKFEKFAYTTDGDGNRIFNENYYKLLEDFTTMVDGEFHPQGNVTATFPGSDSAFGSMADLIKEGLEEDAVTANRLNSEVDGLAEEVRNALGREESGKKFSLTRANDEYMKAVESGNVEEQQRLVDEAAKNAGYDTVLYHGTQSFGFTQIDVSKYSDDGISFFATSNPGMAQTYSAKSGTREIGRKSSENPDKAGNYVLRGRTEGFLEIDGNSHSWSRINTTIEPRGGATTLKVDYDYDSEKLIFSDKGGEFARIDWYAGMPDYALNRKIGSKIDQRYGKAFSRTILRKLEAPLLFDDPHVRVQVRAIKGEFTTREIADFAKEQGYPGVKITGIYDNGGKAGPAGKGDVYIFFNPEQDVKSADPITYDDSGNVIPLTERFDSGNRDIRWSLVGTTDGRPVAVIDKDILDGVPESEWKSVARKAISEGFPDGIAVQGKNIRVNQTTRREYTKSDYTQWLFNHSKGVFADKMRAAAKLDDVVLAATNWTKDGGLKHPRKDNFVDFGRGNVLMSIGGNKYSAEVILAYPQVGAPVLYDVVTLNPDSFDLINEKAASANANAATSGAHTTRFSSDISAPNTVSLTQNTPDVNSQSMQDVEKDSSDERHSLVKSAQSELKALQKENEKLRQMADDLKQELQLTHGRKLSRDALISSIQKILIDRYDVKLSAKELYPHVTNLYDMFYNNTVDGKRLKKDERVDTMRIIEEMDKIVDAVIENAVGVDDTYVEMKKLLPELRKTKLVVPMDARADAAQSAGFENWADLLSMLNAYSVLFPTSPVSVL